MHAVPSQREASFDKLNHALIEIIPPWRPVQDEFPNHLLISGEIMGAVL